MNSDNHIVSAVTSTSQRARSLALARSVSEFGNSLRFIAFPLGVLRVAADPRHLATAEVLETISAFIAGLIIPLFIDRFPKRINLVVADLLSLAVTLFMAVGVYLESLPLLLSAAFAMSGVFVFHDSSLSAATADLTEGATQASMIRGFSQLQVYTLIFGFIGSVVGAPIVKAVPLYAMFGIDAVTFLVSSAWIYSLVQENSLATKIEDKKKDRVTLKGVLKDSWSHWKDGLHAAWADPKTRVLIGAQGILAVGHGLLAATVISHYKVKLKVNDSKVAVAQANNRMWQFMGALVRLRTSWSPRKSILLGAVLMTIGYATMSMVPFYAFLFAYGIQQFGNAILTPTNRAIIMGQVPAELRGRVAAFRGLVIDAGILAGNMLALVVLTQTTTSLNFILAAIALGVATLVYKKYL